MAWGYPHKVSLIRDDGGSCEVGAVYKWSCRRGPCSVGTSRLGASGVNVCQGIFCLSFRSLYLSSYMTPELDYRFSGCSTTSFRLVTELLCFLSAH